MTVGNREFFRKGACEDAGKALVSAVMSWRGDRSLTVRARHKGFEILSRASVFEDGSPDLYVRGKETYKANLNPDSPAGTVSSIEHALRNLDRRAEDEQREIDRQEKALADFKVQMDRPFEHEAQLEELLARQAQLNAALDLDKHDEQTAADSPEGEKAVPASFAARAMAENRAAEMAP